MPSAPECISGGERIISNHLSNVLQIDPITENVGHIGDEMRSKCPCSLTKSALVLATEVRVPCRLTPSSTSELGLNPASEFYMTELLRTGC